MRIATCLLFVLIFALPAVAADVLERGPAASVAERAAREALWVQHLDQFVAAHPELTDEQRAIAASGRALLAGGLLQSLRSPEPAQVEITRQAMLVFEARASQSFSRELYAEAFVRLGQLTRRVRTNGLQPAGALRPECFCNPNYNECGGGECSTGGCWVMPEGCGTFGWDICTGMC